MKTIPRREFIKKGVLAGSLLTFHPVGLKSFAANREQDRKIFIFSKHLQWLDYKEMAKAARQTGFDGVDITVRPKGHVLPGNVERDLPQAVEAVRKEGLVADTITTAITDSISPNAEKIIKTAAQLGIKQYRMGWIQYNADLDISANLENFVQQLAELAQINAHYGIRGDYQNHSGTSLGAVLWDIRQVLNKINSSWQVCVLIFAMLSLKVPSPGRLP